MSLCVPRLEDQRKWKTGTKEFEAKIETMFPKLNYSLLMSGLTAIAAGVDDNHSFFAYARGESLACDEA